MYWDREIEGKQCQDTPKSPIEAEMGEFAPNMKHPLMY